MLSEDKWSGRAFCAAIWLTVGHRLLALQISRTTGQEWLTIREMCPVTWIILISGNVLGDFKPGVFSHFRAVAIVFKIMLMLRLRRANTCV